MIRLILSAILLALTGPGTVRGDEKYAAADRHALNTPSSAEVSIKSLSHYLTKPFSAGDEKARAIFRWVTENISYDVEGYFSGDALSDCRDVLRSRSSICGGYSNLFQALCKEAGLEVKTIGGSAKGFAFHAGDLSGKLESHAWNAVKIRGKWKLVDCTWGAGKVNDDHEYIKEFEPYYFMTRPEEFIYRHFPEEKSWQLLARPLSRREFDDLPLVSPVYFQCGINLSRDLPTVINVTDEYIAELSAPADVMLTATLEQNGMESDDAVFIQRRGNNAKIRILPPADGEYYLHIFAAKRKETQKVPLALSFKIKAKTAGSKKGSFPTIYRTYLETGAQLQEPLVKELAAGSIQRFSLTSPGAEKVAVVSEEEWDFLEKNRDNFEGTVEIGNGKVMVFVSFPGKKEYDALLEYTGTGDFHRAPRPGKYAKFEETKAELFTPVKKELASGTSMIFRLRLPGAIKAAVIIGDKWNYLKKKGDIFEGSVDIDDGKIVVAGMYSGKNNFDGLLEYVGK